MKVIQSNIIPFPGYIAINLFGVVFVRKGRWDKKDQRTQARILNHEAIHTAQMKELAYVGFYVIYGLEWLFRLVFHTSTAYEGISFEREAKANEGDYSYIYIRKHYAQWRRR